MARLKHGKYVGRGVAKKLIPIIDKCELCNRDATDRHHIDGNFGNNNLSNIIVLCRSCHMAVDGRLKRLHMRTRKIVPVKECSNCGKLSKPLRKGLCHCCNEYFRRNGFHRPNFAEKSSVITKEQLELLIKFRIAGLSYRSIQSIMGIAHTTIRTVMIKNKS